MRPPTSGAPAGSAQWPGRITLSFAGIEGEMPRLARQFMRAENAWTHSSEQRWTYSSR
jgi:hypothetical protein